MILIIVKWLLLATFLFVFFQDIKERKVYWFLFPIIGFCCGLLLVKKQMPEIVLYTITTNILFVVFLLIIVSMYSKFKLKTDFKNTFGLGDVLFFFAIAFSFSSISFIILFVFALIFSLILHLFLKKKSTYKTVPLAGYMSLFFACIYTTHWLGFINTVYTI
ncbi:hypothetical protein [uncultured Lacinutrix sp.]|uniref:hypothetical protein n=1 Tax=uncultured Lacinutrix sp. TaxID=574032 RepID=UPI00260A7D4B|nr:hypothetical protein [uncultured Lacinutrix sp.]